jgi:hypothetical protein
MRAITPSLARWVPQSSRVIQGPRSLRPVPASAESHEGDSDIDSSCFYVKMSWSCSKPRGGCCRMLPGLFALSSAALAAKGLNGLRMCRCEDRGYAAMLSGARTKRMVR